MLELNFTPFPVLSTEHLNLRRLEPGDDNEIFLLRSDEGVNKYIDRPKAESLADAQKFIHKILKNISNNEVLFWVITTKNSHRLLGTVILWNIVKEEDKAELGYELLPNCQGKGIMQEAVAKVVDYGFNILKLKTIVAHAHKDNEASIKLLNKFNFIRDTIAESKHIGQDEFRDMTIYSLQKN